MTRLDQQIADAERAVTDAIRRRDTRGSHHAINHLRALRTKRLRRENRWASLRALLGPLGRIAATLAMFAVAAALYTVANIEDAAAQTTSAVHLVAQRPTWGEVVGLFIVLTIAAASTLALLRDGRRNLTEDDFD